MYGDKAKMPEPSLKNVKKKLCVEEKKSGMKLLLDRVWERSSTQRIIQDRQNAREEQPLNSQNNHHNNVSFVMKPFTKYKTKQQRNKETDDKHIEKIKSYQKLGIIKKFIKYLAYIKIMIHENTLNMQR